ncbi:helix-turn-helix transcriptional regulator [Nonomuraea sp. NPDC046802]|uniref:helix-turn-helix domain-containing protein n=1 Tax=Nonomuraea sp. NPDC046802 TaxID=3154919 RepID=UPI0033F92FF3
MSEYEVAQTALVQDREGSVRFDQAPNSYIAEGEWPEARLSPDAPVGAHVEQEIARRLRAVMAERGLKPRGLADLSGIGYRTIGRVLLGDVYPDVATLARLEAALMVDLYPTGWYRDFPEGLSRR